MHDEARRRAHADDAGQCSWPAAYPGDDGQ